VGHIGCGLTVLLQIASKPATTIPAKSCRKEGIADQKTLVLMEVPEKCPYLI
jgi:hypothetical protein